MSESIKMGRVEKFSVNSGSKSRRVSKSADRLLSFVAVRPRQRYLDVGTGNGVAAIHVARTYGLAVTGVDVDPDQIQLAAAKAWGTEGVQFWVEDATRLPFQENEYDVVFTSKAIHHIPNWQDAIAEIARVLKPGGHLLYTDLVFPRWMAALGEKVARNRGGYPTVEALNALAGQLGLVQIHSSRVFMGYEAVFQKASG
jgi:ubiquinone/menaquinone biosynthesis C-methylase UbiE